MSPRPSTLRLHRPLIPRATARRGGALLTAMALAACTAPPDDAGGAKAAAAGAALSYRPSDPLGVVGVAPEESGGELVGRFVDNVAPDSRLQASWSLYPTEHHVGIVHVAIAGAHYLLADTLVGYDGPKARWRIRQMQRIPAPDAGEAYVTSCALAGRNAADGTIVARVTLTRGDTLPSPHAAWRFDPLTWRFLPLPTNALSCYNEEGGP